MAYTKPSRFLDFEWDEAKAESNRRKHGISFSTATLAFYDPYAVYLEVDIVGNEERLQILGRVEGQLILLVVHTSQEGDAVETVRIISARIAEHWERRLYDENGPLPN